MTQRLRRLFPRVHQPPPWRVDAVSRWMLLRNLALAVLVVQIMAAWHFLRLPLPLPALLSRQLHLPPAEPLTRSVDGLKMRTGEGLRVNLHKRGETSSVVTVTGEEEEGEQGEEAERARGLVWLCQKM